jgi:hypothetical protein
MSTPVEAVTEVSDHADTPAATSRAEPRGSGSSWVQRWRGDIFGVSTLVALAIAYLSPALKDGVGFGDYDGALTVTSLGSGLYSSIHNLINGDSVTEMTAWNAFDWRAIHSLQFPLWNGLSLLGVPEFLNFQSGVLSLPNIVSYAVPLQFAFLVVVFMRLVIAGTGAYVFCRVIGVRPFPATAGGVIFMLSGGFASWLAWPLADVVSWIGWIAALVLLAYRSGGRRGFAVLLALAVAFCIYGGFPAGYFFVIGGLAVLFVVAGVVRVLGSHRVSWRGLTHVLIGLAGGAALSSPLWFPGLQVIHASHRNAVAGFTGGSLKTLDLLVAPGFYGLPIKGSTSFLTGTNYYESAVYVGVIALVLVAVAAVENWRRPIVAGLVVTTVAVVVVSYQTNSFHVVADIVRHTPLDTLTFGRMKSVIGFPVGALAAVGLETLMSRQGASARRPVAVYWAATALVAVCVGGLCIYAATGSLPGNLRHLRFQSLIWPVVSVLACVLVGVLLIVARRRESFRIKLKIPFVLAGAAILVAGEGAFLLFSGVGLNSYSQQVYPASPAMTELRSIVGSGLVGLDTGDPKTVQDAAPVGFHPEVNLGYSVAEFGAYDPLLPIQYFTVFTPPSTKVGASGLVTPDIDSATLARRYGIPWILQVPNARTAPPGARYVATLAGERLYAVPGASQFSLVSSNGTAAGHVLSAQAGAPGSWTVRVVASAPSTLVMRVTDVPGLHATVNGQPLVLARYDGVMLSTTVPAGTDTVRLWYMPGRLVIATWVALASIVLMVAWLASPLVVRRLREASTSRRRGA